MAPASQFYLRYDADETFPEQDGWSRRTTGPAGEIKRGIEDGVFWLDTRASALISDSYLVFDPALEVAPGESLHVTWRMRTLETDTFGYISDVVVGVTNAAREYVTFFLAPEFVSEQGEAPPGEPEHYYPIQGGVFHWYQFATSDMQAYELYVDGQLAIEGSFSGNSWTPGPYVRFGDGIVGRTSLSEWDFVEVAVIPEPSGLGLLVGLAVACLCIRSL